MDISPTAAQNSSSYSFHNGTEVEYNPLYLLNMLLSVPTNSYVIWLIMRGTGNGLAAEFFILNLSICEMFISVESFCLFLVSKFQILLNVVSFLDGLSTTGRPLFQCLICVERYLAVVHPVTFLKYKPLRYRLICCVVAWVNAFVSSGIIAILVIFQRMFYFVYLFAQFLLFLSIELFCLVSVLRALKKSGPGERMREREEENTMKKRAFQIILITNMTTLIIYAPYTVLMCLLPSSNAPYTILSFSSVFFILAGLVQPLLFLYRVRKLPFRNCQ